MKLAQAVCIAAWTLNIIASALAAAEFPETVIASKWFTPVCTNRFATAKTAFCIPAGIPSMSTSAHALRLMYFREGLSAQQSLRRTRCTTISPAERYCEITLAAATPEAAIPQQMTKKRFSATLSAPAIERYISGRLVSPQALSIPLPKLYTAIAGIPREYIRR